MGLPLLGRAIPSAGSCRCCLPRRWRHRRRCRRLLTLRGRIHHRSRPLSCRLGWHLRTPKDAAARGAKLKAGPYVCSRTSGAGAQSSWAIGFDYLEEGLAARGLPPEHKAAALITLAVEATVPVQSAPLRRTPLACYPPSAGPTWHRSQHAYACDMLGEPPLAPAR